LSAARLERAIGVISRPQADRQSHFLRAFVSNQFDAVIHLDETRALEWACSWSMARLAGSDLPGGLNC